MDLKRVRLFGVARLQNEVGTKHVLFRIYEIIVYEKCSEQFPEICQVRLLRVRKLLVRFPARFLVKKIKKKKSRS